MIIEIKNKKVNLVLKTRKIVDISNILKNKNFEEAFTKAYSILDMEALSKIIFKISESESEENAFTNSDEVYDFIDECRKEGMTIKNLYEKIAEALNDEGFFKKKMTKKELKEIATNPLSTLNLDKIVEKSAENVVGKIIEQEF